MAQSDWAEVRRLAADLQRLQQTSTSHRLTERNCVELVTMLVKRGLLDVLYTRDGKEYVTPSQLEREIRDELIIHGGIGLISGPDVNIHVVYMNCTNLEFT